MSGRPQHRVLRPVPCRTGNARPAPVRERVDRPYYRQHLQAEQMQDRQLQQGRQAAELTNFYAPYAPYAAVHLITKTNGENPGRMTACRRCGAAILATGTGGIEGVGNRPSPRLSATNNPSLRIAHRAAAFPFNSAGETAWP